MQPPPRAGRTPATRPADAVQQAGRASLGGDPMAGVAPVAIPAVIRTEFPAPSRIACPVCGDHEHAPASPEPTRSLRVRMVEAGVDQGLCQEIEHAAKARLVRLAVTDIA